MTSCLLQVADYNFLLCSVYTCIGGVGYVYMISGSLVVAANLFTAIICSLSEQESKVAGAFSILHNSEQYDNELAVWWREFAPLRTRAVWMFILSIPLFFLTMACQVQLNVVAMFRCLTNNMCLQCYICNPNGIGIAGLCVLLISGFATFKTVMAVNRQFRKSVLKVGGTKHPVYFENKRSD